MRFLNMETVSFPIIDRNAFGTCNKMRIRTSIIAVVLGLLSALGPMGIDMYVGALPQMADQLHGSASDLQVSVTAFFFGFTLGQLFYGPLSDRTGRKPIILLATAIFIVGSLGCLSSQSAAQLCAWRFLQGLGGSIGMVIAAAIVRDLFTGALAARMMSMVVLVVGVAPIIAPLIGSLLLRLAGWRAIFILLAAFGTLCAIVARILLPETRAVEQRTSSGVRGTLRLYGRLLVSRNFIPYAGALALAQGAFFAYVAGSSFVFVKIYGLSPLSYSLLFGLNAVGLGMASQFANHLIRRYGLVVVARGGSLALATGGLLLLAAGTAGFGILVTAPLLFLMISSLGGILPTCNVLALEAHGPISGSAAALSGSLSFGMGAAASLLLSTVENGSALPMMIIMFVCSLGSLALTIGFFRNSAIASEQGAPAKATS